MADSIESVAVGNGGAFELTLKTESGALQKFELPIQDIAALVQQLTAVAWASAANNRPPAGTVLPPVSAYPVRASHVGLTQDSREPVLLVQLFGGVELGLLFTREAGRGVAAELERAAASGPVQ